MATKKMKPDKAILFIKENWNKPESIQSRLIKETGYSISTIKGWVKTLKLNGVELIDRRTLGLKKRNWSKFN